MNYARNRDQHCQQLNAGICRSCCWISVGLSTPPQHQWTSRGDYWYSDIIVTSGLSTNQLTWLDLQHCYCSKDWRQEMEITLLRLSFTVLHQHDTNWYLEALQLDQWVQLGPGKPSALCAGRKGEVIAALLSSVNTTVSCLLHHTARELRVSCSDTVFHPNNAKKRKGEVFTSCSCKHCCQWTAALCNKCIQVLLCSVLYMAADSLVVVYTWEECWVEIENLGLPRSDCGEFLRVVAVLEKGSSFEADLMI